MTRSVRLGESVGLKRTTDSTRESLRSIPTPRRLIIFQYVRSSSVYPALPLAVPIKLPRIFNYREVNNDVCCVCVGSYYALWDLCDYPLCEYNARSGAGVR